MKPEEALSYYQVEGAIEKIAPFGLGYINDTFLVKTMSSQYLLQKVNNKVFRVPSAIENNIRLVLAHAPELFPTFERTKQGDIHLVDQNDEIWRLQQFIAHGEAPTAVHEPSEAYQIGFGFGSFTRSLIQVDPEEVQEAIPNFLDIGLRFAKFEAVVALDPLGRNTRAKELINSARNYEWIHQHFLRLVKEGLPSRVCHNDTKTTNILVDVNTRLFSKVIDLDTIGPGYVLFDFGDMIRSMATPSHEADQLGVSGPLQTKLIEAVRNGYLDACGMCLEPSEIDSLSFGGLYMTYFTGIRMLTDYLEGDVYYKIASEDDNLIRARNQFYILDLLADHYQIIHGA